MGPVSREMGFLPLGNAEMFTLAARFSEIAQKYRANHSAATLRKNLQSHDPASPLLCGAIAPEDIIRDRKMESCKVGQMGLNGLRNL